jgi:phage FluMu gp28-like protein
MIQNYLKTFDNTKKKDVPFKLFPRQQDLCRALGDASNVVTTKPRQAGITTTSGAFIACEMCLADKESPQTVLAIGNTLDLAQQMLFKIRDFLMQFPLWMWGDEFMDLGFDPMAPPPNKNVIFNRCNSKELILKNGCKVVARSSGPDASRGVGGVQWLIFDEAAFIENGKDVYASALPTVSTGGHIIMISTPNGKDMLYYETCRQAKLKGTKDWNNFELVEMKWYQDPRYNKFLEWYRKNTETGDIDVEPEV